MKHRNEKFLLVAGVLGAMSLALPGAASAQAPPGPIQGVPSQDGPPPAPVKPAPTVQARSSMDGPWRFNKDDSDDPRQKMQDAHASSGNNGGMGRRGGIGFPGGGYPGGGYPSGGGNSGRNSSQDDAERQELQQFLNPPRDVTVTDMKTGEVDLMEDQAYKRVLFTDGRKIEKSKDPSYKEIAAHWEGSRLVTDEKVRGKKVSRTFELAPDGKQLYETVNLTTGHNNTPVVIRYVYDAIGNAPAKSAPPAANAPAPAPSPNSAPPADAPPTLGKPQE